MTDRLTDEDHVCADLRDAVEIQWTHDALGTIEVAKMLQRERHFRQFMEFFRELAEGEN